MLHPSPIDDQASVYRKVGREEACLVDAVGFCLTLREFERNQADRERQLYLSLASKIKLLAYTASQLVKP
jgi:hypothetical protein